MSEILMTPDWPEVRITYGGTWPKWHMATYAVVGDEHVYCSTAAATKKGCLRSLRRQVERAPMEIAKRKDARQRVAEWIEATDE